MGPETKELSRNSRRFMPVRLTGLRSSFQDFPEPVGHEDLLARA